MNGEVCLNGEVCFKWGGLLGRFAWGGLLEWGGLLGRFALKINEIAVKKKQVGHIPRRLIFGSWVALVRYYNALNLFQSVHSKVGQKNCDFPWK